MRSQLDKEKPPLSWRDQDILEQLFAWTSEGHRCAVATLVGVDGSSPRPVGSQMVVNEKGAHLGYVTSGCAEAEIARRAVDAIKKQVCILERYGKNSPYMDIRLPCGSGIDVFIDPFWKQDTVLTLLQHLSKRKITEVVFNMDEKSSVQVANKEIGSDAVSRSERGQFFRVYRPGIEVICFGEGPIAQSFQNLSANMGWFVEQVVSSNEDTYALFDEGARRTMKKIENFDFKETDGATALVLLLHNHEIEPVLLKKALATDSFYIGALGSRKTHAARCEDLRKLGTAEKDIARIKGPVGLNIGAQEPEEIALSIVVGILQMSRMGAS